MSRIKIAFEKIVIDRSALSAATGSALDKAYGTGTANGAANRRVGIKRAVALAAALAAGIMLAVTVAAKVMTGSFIGFFMEADPRTEHYVDEITSNSPAQTAVSGNYALTLESYANDSGSLYMLFQLASVDGSRLPVFGGEFQDFSIVGASGLFNGGNGAISENFRILDWNNYLPGASSVYLAAIISTGGEPVTGEHNISVTGRRTTDEDGAVGAPEIDGKWSFAVNIAENFPTRLLTADVEGVRYDLSLTPMSLRYGFDDKDLEWFEGREYGANCVDALEIDGEKLLIPIDSYGHPNQFYPEFSGNSRFERVIEPDSVTAVYVNGKRYPVAEAELGGQSIFDTIDDHYGKVAMDGYCNIKDVCVKAADGKYGAMGVWEDPDIWEAPESEFLDGALRNLSDGNGDVIALPPMAFRAGDSIIVHIDLDLSNRWSDSESEYNLIGYYLEDKFIELFAGKVAGGGYDIPATMPADGDYTFVVMNCSAGGQFYREISVMQP